jgi:predicted nuclease with TOPRIM domain
MTAERLQKVKRISQLSETLIATREDLEHNLEERDYLWDYEDKYDGEDDGDYFKELDFEIKHLQAEIAYIKNELNDLWIEGN